MEYLQRNHQLQPTGSFEKITSETSCILDLHFLSHHSHSNPNFGARFLRQNHIGTYWIIFFLDFPSKPPLNPMKSMMAPGPFLRSLSAAELLRALWGRVWGAQRLRWRLRWRLRDLGRDFLTEKMGMLLFGAMTNIAIVSTLYIDQWITSILTNELPEHPVNEIVGAIIEYLRCHLTIASGFPSARFDYRRVVSGNDCYTKPLNMAHL